MRFGKLFLMVCLWGIAGTGFCQHYRILHWGVENGLSQGINQKIIQDANGFLWITSYEGVNRFDGKTFRNFYSSSKKRNSILGTQTTGLVEDSLHKIWIGSGYGLNRYDPVTDSVITFTAAGLPAKSVQYIIPVAATRNEVICFQFNGQLIAYNITTFARRVVAENIKWFDDFINVHNAWPDIKTNTLWMPAATGIAKVDISTGKTSYYFQDRLISAIVNNERTGTMLLGTDNGFIEWDAATNVFTVIQSLQSVPLGKVTSLAIDKEYNYWVGTEEQGLFIKSADNAITHLVKTDDPLNSINGNKINTIFCDNAGIVWLGVATNGIDQLVPGNRFTHYSEDLKSKNSLSNNIIRCFLEDDNKNIWIATQGGGINIYNPLTQTFSSLTRKNIPGLPFDFIRFLVKDDQNRAWIGTEKGMCRMNMQTYKATGIQFSDTGHQLLRDPYIEQIIDFRDNSWLIATKDFGLFQLNKGSDTAHQLAYPGNKHVFYTAFVNDLLFVCVWDDNPKIFTIKNGKWEELKKDITSAFVITWVLHDAREKKYWIGTLKGLLETDEQLNVLRQYTTDDGLSNHYIYAMLLDHDGMLWISTNKGLSLFNTLTKTFRVFTPADGLQGYEYNAKAAAITSDGTLYFGGTNGFDLVKKTTASLPHAPAKFYIKEFLVNNVPLPGKENINYTSAIQLPYSGNNLTIQAGAIDFITRGNSKIRYRLENVDAGWKTADRDFIINYSGLPPGEYKFVATAANINNEWNEKVTTLTITIAKPWWLSWWLRLSVAALLTGIATIIIRSYYHRKLEKQRVRFERQQAVQHERTRIATDMHDDLGAGLSRIKFLGETINIKQQQQEPIEEDIGKIKEYSHEMINKMGEIVWALNEKNDSLNDLVAYIRSYTMEYLSENNIECTPEITDNLPETFVSGEFRRNIFLSVKEALHNIVKHAHASHVYLSIIVADKLSISIRDNGIGFDPNNTRPFSNGLTNIKTRIHNIGGKTELKQQQGTELQLEAPLPV
jgi:signal transduction histidine kinase/ligand-binding sensor domain-containing protein